jgi:predicted anti-sigma-YlaC factor YlaD
MKRAARAARRAAALVIAACAVAGCSIKKFAVDQLGNALSEGSSSFAKDEDPQLVWDAAPFALKTVEALLEESPRHRGLLLSAASGFTQYAYGSLQQDADFIEDKDLQHATELRRRAKRLYLRALDYAFRGLERDLPGFREALRKDHKAALATASRKHVPLLYWAAAAWGAAIAIEVTDSELAADQYLTEALMKRALELDESWEYGSIHDFFIGYEGARASVGGSYERARQHLERATALSHGQRAWPFVSYAENVAVPRQDKQDFARALERALAVDPNAIREQRVSNLIAQKRARWLLGRVDELFVE